MVDKTKASRGRAKLAGSVTSGKSPAICIRVPHGAKEKIDRCAIAAGLSPSEWVRKLIDQAPDVQ
jgi:hypothetical protein